MYKHLQIIKDPFVKVMSIPFYLFLTFLITVLLVSITSLIINYQLIGNILFSQNTILFKLIFIFNMLGSIVTNNTELSLLTLIITSFLAAVNVSMLIYKYRSNMVLKNYEKTSKSGSAEAKTSAGVLAGILASGCSSCGVGVLAILGVTGGVAILPFGGFEIWIISIVILIYSLYTLSKEINSCKACQITKYPI